MLRSNDTIRLTPNEKEVFGALAVDSSKAPTTVAEHNARLDLAAQVWAEGDSPEERLAAALAEDLKI